MKALVYTAPGRVELQELTVPTMKSGEALIKIRAVGVCGSDLHGFLGKSKKRIPPLVLGHEFCGEVSTVTGAAGFKPGEAVAVYPLIGCGHCEFCRSQRENLCADRKVYGLDFHGGLAEYVSVPSHCLFRMPAGMSFLEGSLVEPLANAIHVVEKCGPITGQTGLVIGAGPIGVCVLWVARQLGANRMAIVDINHHRLITASNLGPDLVIEATREDPVEAVLKWTGGRGVDFSIDAVGNSECRVRALKCLRMGGTTVWIGLEEDSYGLDARAVVTQEISIRGTYAYTKADFQRSIALLQTKKLPYAAFTREADLLDGQAIFDDLASGRSTITKAVFVL